MAYINELITIHTYINIVYVPIVVAIAMKIVCRRVAYLYHRNEHRSPNEWMGNGYMVSFTGDPADDDDDDDDDALVYIIRLLRRIFSLSLSHYFRGIRLSEMGVSCTHSSFAVSVCSTFYAIDVNCSTLFGGVRRILCHDVDMRITHTASFFSRMDMKLIQ